MLLLTVTAICVWEISLRKKGVTISYDEGGPLWAHQRQKAYLPQDQATVFIGSSRIKFDLDTRTWRDITGETPVLLAREGNSPLPALHELAADTRFKGKLVVDVTEGLFFSTSPNNAGEIGGDIKYYKGETPAQKSSFYINQFLESNLVLLDKDNLSLSACLNQLEIPSRKGVFMFPIFPMDFNRVNAERQCLMTPKFLADSQLQQRVQNIWKFFASLSKDKKPLSGKPLDSLLNAVKTSVDKIRARGGKVLFVRTPSSGPYWMGEQQGYPRNLYWDRLLTETGCAGIHFRDYPAIDHFVCPEWSHLSPQDAILFTRAFIDILEKEKGWSFRHK